MLVSALLALFVAPAPRPDDAPAAPKAEAGRVAVACAVEGRTTVLTLRPEGTIVREGDLIGELDSAGLRDLAADQEIVAQRAEADFQAAAKSREVAEVARKEYVEGTAPLELKEAKGAIRLAEIAIDQAGTALVQARQKAALGGQGQQDAVRRAEIDLQRARNARAAAEERLRVLAGLTAPRRLKELDAAIATARATEAARRTEALLEGSKLQKLRDQVAKCRVLAPVGGRIVYANRPGRAPAIAEGAIVRERQVLVWIDPDASGAPGR